MYLVCQDSKITVLAIFEFITMKQPLVNCPQCGKIIVWDTANRYRPFCSERCKMIDLGQWATESYRIPEKDAEEDDALNLKPAVDRSSYDK